MNNQSGGGGGGVGLKRTFFKLYLFTQNLVPILHHATLSRSTRHKIAQGLQYYIQSA